MTARAEEVPAPASPYIVNGDSAAIGDHPYYAQVFSTVTGQGTFFCGGSVVAPTKIITAAHCVDGVDRIEVITGSDRLGIGRVTRVARWSLNGWRPSTSQNDVAVLHLARSVPNKPIKVVGPNSDYRWAGSGNTLTVAGMGCTHPLGSVCNSGAGGPSDILYAADIPSRSDTACDGDLALWGGIDARSMLCAGTVSSPFGSHNAPNACFGDSGGPLTVEGPGGAPLLVGAVSWGANNCGDYPVAYARLARFRSWLRSQGVPVDRDPFAAGDAPVADWDSEPIVGDFNGDGRDDIVWFEVAAAVHRLRIGTRSGGFISRPGITFSASLAPLAGDFDGDGRTDLLIDEPGTANDAMMQNKTTGWVTGPKPRVGDATFTRVGDFDGDGRDDVIAYGAGTLPDELRYGTKSGLLRLGPAFNVKGVYDDGVVLDHDGDGIDDVLWFGHGSALDALRYGTSTLTFRNGPALSVASSRVPIVEDFSGDGRDDIIYFDPAGEDTLRESGRSAPFVTGPEIVLDGAVIPVGGDFDGDAVGDILWYRPGVPSERFWLGLPA